MKIITLTLNPAFDIHCYVEHFAPYHENLARITDYDPSGKGINISRALCAGGVDNLAFAVLGDENGDSFVKGLEKSGLTLRTVTVKGRIRENITLHTEGADETRISFSGFSADESLLDRTLEALESEIEEGSLITFTGRVPGGIGMPAIQKFLSELTRRGAHVVIDSKSFGLSDLIDAKPWLIKPNEEEISEYLNRPIEHFEEVLSAARELHESGIENVMISLGGKGALLVCREGAFVATPPSIRPLSTIGAGDSSVAGFLAAAAAGESSADCLKRAVSYGTSACLTEGTRPPRSEDLAPVYRQVTVKEL